MKAVISVIVEDEEDNDKLKKAKNLYYNNASIYIQPDDETKFNDTKNKCMKFLEED